MRASAVISTLVSSFGGSSEDSARSDVVGADSDTLGIVSGCFSQWVAF